MTWSSRRRPTSARCRRCGGATPGSCPCPRTATACARTCWRRSWPRGCDRACYVVANFQNPSGGTLSLDRRRHLAELAERYGFVIIEDDPYGALRFRGDPVPPVRTFTELAVTLGTVSKLLAPGLGSVGWRRRTGCMGPSCESSRPPICTRPPSASAWPWTCSRTSRSCRPISPDWARSTAPDATRWRRARPSSVTGSASTCRTAACSCGCGCKDRPPRRGTCCPGRWRPGVAFVPGEAFHVDGTGADRIRLSFATLTPEELGEAAARLARAWTEDSHGGAPGADALRATITCFRDTLRAHARELDRLNVYPSPTATPAPTWPARSTPSSSRWMPPPPSWPPRAERSPMAR